MPDTPTLTDVTAVFDHYRVSARSIWNNAFRPDPEFREGFYIGQFEWIAKILFDTLVLTRLDMEFSSEDLFHKPIPFFKVTLASGASPIMIENPRPGDGNGYWDDPVKQITKDVEMQFINFFDWDQIGVLDFRYYRVHIAKFDERPHLVGRRALLETIYAKVFFADEQEST